MDVLLERRKVIKECKKVSPEFHPQIENPPITQTDASHSDHLFASHLFFSRRLCCAVIPPFRTNIAFHHSKFLQREREAAPSFLRPSRISRGTHCLFLPPSFPPSLPKFLDPPIGLNLPLLLPRPCPPGWLPGPLPHLTSTDRADQSNPSMSQLSSCLIRFSPTSVFHSARSFFSVAFSPRPLK